MTKIYVAFYDPEEGWDREHWNTFYTPWVASTTEQGAKNLAEEKIREMILENFSYFHKIDFKTDEFTEIKDQKLREEIRREYEGKIKEYHIEIQEGEMQ